MTHSVPTRRSSDLALLLDVAQKYFAVLAARDAAVFAHAETIALKEQLDHAQSRSDAGLATLADVKAADASYAIASVDETDARNTLIAAQLALESLTGRRYSEIGRASCRERVCPYV